MENKGSPSSIVLFHPCYILVHPVLQELFAVCTDVAGLVKQPILYMDECFGLTKSQYAQKRENVAQMLLCNGRADDADRSAQNTSWLPRPGVLTMRTRSVVDRILEHAGDRAVVFGCNEQRALSALDILFQPLHGLCLVLWS